MKILVIHNRYRQKGGEDTTFEQEVEMLRHSEEVKTLIFQNLNGWKGLVQFIFSIWNIRSAFAIRKAIRSFHPDVVHVHNWHYAVGPIVIRTVHKMGIPVVLTVQNFRMLCPSSTLLFKDVLFLDSLSRSFPWTAIRKRVYRNSLLQTFWLAFIIWVHKKMGTWKLANMYILQTEMAKSVFVSSSLGVQESRFVVKPNFISDTEVVPQDREEFFLYIGRLSVEKGIEVLLDSFKNKNRRLLIGGDGPYKEKVLQATDENPQIKYLGLLDKRGVRDLMSRCSALVFPSIWYEGMPLTLIEAFAAGTPVIASNLGAMSSMIRDGFNGIHFTPGSVTELSVKLENWQKMNKNEKQRFNRNARIVFENNYTAERNMSLLLSVYNVVIKEGFNLT